ncbi:MAG: glycosyltransferase family 39 protein [Myxococcota bacterium]|nr:glycosyltransferase family 39 protein [Myxococcota bacterium]
MWFPKNKRLIQLMVAGFVLRGLPLLIWINTWPCVRDECTYLRLAERMSAGQGMTSSVGWLWAPGYPALLALSDFLTGWGSNIKIAQLIISTLLIAFMFRVGKQISGDERVGLWAAGLYALSPTQIFFAQSLWSECFYGGFLLLAFWLFNRLLELDEDVKKQLKLAFQIGALVGVCVLFRGVATYMLPIFVVAVVWGKYRKIESWKQAGILLLGTILVVTPYSVYISNKFNHRIVSDRTMGQMMWLGNNDFDPVTFDWGNGQLSRYEFKQHTDVGRKPCGSRKDAMDREDCQTENGKEWIRNNPEAFVRRMPLRVAQLLNPHSFLTRHLRWGYWRGLPQMVDEFLIVWNVLWSLTVLWLGVTGLCVWGRSSRGLLIGGILIYHVAAISVLAGLTRYRVPLEPLLMLYAAGILADPKSSWNRFKGAKWRMAVWAVCAAAGIPLTLYFLPVGWVWWQHW